MGADGLRGEAKGLYAQLSAGAELRAPFVDEEPVRARLCSGQLYALACSLIFNVPLRELQRDGADAAAMQGGLLDFLARNGYHVLDAEGDAQQAADHVASFGQRGDQRRIDPRTVKAMISGTALVPMDLNRQAVDV